MEISTIDKDFKQCYECAKFKPMVTDNFAIDNSTKDGYCNYCKTCKNKAMRRRYWDNKRNTKSGLYTNCHRCKFQPECRHNIWNRDWWPYCFTTSKYHDLFIREYGKENEK